MEVICPACRKRFQADVSGPRDKRRWLPFCSERCRALDLGRWLDEEYRITESLADREAAED
jgi:endogenous inhibitor of DNA gyrase (YacG/DUF329 family)